MDITSYDTTGGSTIIPTAAPSDGVYVYAWAYDGTAATPANVTATPIQTTIIPTSTSISSTSSAPSNTASVSLGVLMTHGLFLLYVLYL